MAPEITSPKYPIAVRPDYIASRQTTLRVNQHSLSVTGGDFTISDRADIDNGSSKDVYPLFTVNCKLASLTQRHQFLDKSGLPLFDLARKASGVTWFLRVPDEGASCESIATIAPRWSYFKDKFDVYARGLDIWKLRTNFYANGSLVMTSKRTDKILPYIPGKRPEWQVDVAKGMDLALAAVLAVHLTELLYWKSLPSSHNSASDTQGSSREPLNLDSKNDAFDTR
ncbi:hypothetical protein N7456_000370 [Penicillium angulare]|uniref:Uncharacterized protein n=1 Tax=Penicillium angulare TaxID=116970 RepID=A0A9W9GC02_9EURO|nr:hypothetical protein N7456_000370 [Penicillium angulare]